MEIVEVTEITDAIVAAFERLVPQLSPNAPAPSQVHLVNLVASKCTTLLLAVEGEEVIGTLTLACYPIPSGTRVWIEDVIVDAGARGRGIGTALIEEALQRARKTGARYVDLTSRPSRAAANRLYQRLGFEQRETNAYRIYLDREGA